MIFRNCTNQCQSEVGSTPLRQVHVNSPVHASPPSDALHRSKFWLSLALAAATSGTTVGQESLISLPPTPRAAVAAAIEPETATTPSRSTEIQIRALESATSAPVVTALATSPDGRFLAIAGDDHAIRILDSSSGEEVQVVIGHRDWIRALAFHTPGLGSAGRDPAAPATPLLYSAGDDGLVLEWTFVQPLQAREVVRLPFAVRTLDVSDDEQLLAIGGFSTDVLVWDLSNQELLQRLRCPSGDQRCVQFSPDGSRVLCGGRGGEITLWQPRSGQQLGKYTPHRGRVTAAVFSADGSQITSVGEDRRIVRWDLTTGRSLWDRELGRGKLQALCMLGEYSLAAAGSDNRIRIVDLASNNIVAELAGHWGTVAVLATCGNKLISGSFDTTVRIWDLEGVGEAGQPASAGLPVTVPVQMDTDWEIR